MNKNCYRIIYNKARQMFMAVAENAKSQSKTSGQSSGSTTVTTRVDDESFHQLWHVKALVACMSLWMPLSSVYAGMVADTGAPAANRPVIGVGQNSQKQNIPVINIQTPNKSGVSHNIYKEFDVSTQGAVLNNSRTGAASSIVGSVGANPYLQTGEARLILNEVNSARASQFEGNLEIAGQRADLIIANPSGINVKGGGFINANRATLTTGKPQFNADGSIKQFVIDQGKITISANTGSQLGLGGANNNANYLDIYSRALELNAQLHAGQDIQVVTGANTISADLTQIQNKTSTAAAPTVAIDVKALGGMYANNIYLVGTEKGLGVNNAGTLQAVNNLVITSAGKIEHTGAISSTSKTQGLVSISTTGTGVAGDINSSGSINSNSMISIDSGNNLNVNAKEIMINQVGVTASPLIINTKGNLNLAANTRIFNDSVGGDVYVDTANINLATNAGITSNRGSAMILANQSLISNKGNFIAAKDLNLVGNTNLQLTDTRLHASLGDINLQSSLKDSNTNNINVQGGSVYVFKGLNVYSDQDITLNNINFLEKTESPFSQINSLNVYAGNNLSFTTANQVFPYTAGKIQLGAGNALTVHGTGTRSTLKGGGGLSLSGKSVTTKNIQLAGSSAKDLDIISNGGNILLDQGTGLWANTGNINVNALNGSITANSLQAATLGKASILASKNVILAANKVETAVTGTDAKNITYTPSKITAEKGIQVASIDNGYLQLNTINLDAKDGDIQLDAKSGIRLVRSDVLTQYQNADSSFSPKTTYLWSELNGKNILINSGSYNSLLWGNLTATGNILAQAKGKQDLYGVNLKSGANTTLHSDGSQTLLYTTGQSAGHTALSTKDRLHLSSLIVAADGTTNWGVGNTVKLQADGVLSLVSGAGQYLQNTDITGGAVLIESGGGFDVNKNVKVAATSSPLLNNDKDLKKLNGNLSIQTNDNLTIDPKLLTLSAVGDIDLMSKKGDLTLIGHGGTKGNGSEEVITLNSANGGINLQGNKVELQGTQLAAAKDINIVATSGDVVIDGVKNKLISSPSQSQVSDLNLLKYVNDQRWQYVNRLINDDYQPIHMKEAYLDFKSYLENEGVQINNDLSFYSSNLNGYEHKRADIKASGNINIASKNGILVRGASVSGGGKVLLEAKGTLNKALTAKDVQDQVNAGILIDGVIDSYEKGNENDANYSVKELFKGSYISSQGGVDIKVTGAQATDNLVIQGTKISSLGNVNLESTHDLLLLAGQDQSYDKWTNITKKRSWYGKKKTITTIDQYINTSSIPVEISAQNINLKSLGDTSLYSTEMEARSGGKIDIKARNLKLLVTDELNKRETTTRKKSSFWGLKYNDTKTNNSYKELTQVPVKAKADYINTRSDFDTLIQGAEFNYLKGASIQAGGTITLLPATNLVETTFNKTSNSVVWQSMQDQGSITETSKLPTFNGPVAPKFVGSLTVQVPVAKRTANQKELIAEIEKLAKTPGNSYLQGLIDNKDQKVNWEQVLLTNENWDYKSQGLTAAGAAILAIAIAVATGGAGATSAFGSLGATTMGHAAMTGLVTQASISMVNNGGDLGKTLKELGSKETVKSLAITVVTAGLMESVSTNLKVDLKGFPTAEKIANNFVQGVGSNLISSTLQGESLSDSLEKALLAGLSSSIQGELASKIKGLEDVDYILHKIAHAAAGCLAGALQKSCEAGAIGAAVGEMVAESLLDGRSPTFLSLEEKSRIEGYSKLIAGTVTAYAGFDVNVAANSASVAIENNAFKDKALVKMEAARKYLDDKSKVALDELISLYKKGDIVAAQQAKNKLDDAIGNWASSGGYEVLGINPKAAVGAMAFAVGELLIPVNITDVGGVKKVVQKGVGQLEKAAKSINKVENGSVTVLTKATPDENELRAGVGLATLGYDVQHLPTASQLGVQNVRTADLHVSGLGNIDVFTPISVDTNKILRGIEKKSSQANGVLVQVDLSINDMTNIANRMWGKSNAQNIKTIMFQDSTGKIFEFKRP